MTAKQDLRDSTFDAERDIDRLFTAFGRGVAASVRRHADHGKITPVTRHFVLTELDPLLDAIYGVAHGQPSALGEMIVARCGEVRMKVVDAAVAQIRRILHRNEDMLRAMGDVSA